MKGSLQLLLKFLRIKFKIQSFVSTHWAAKSAFKVFCTPIVKEARVIPEIFFKADKISFESNHLKINGFRWKPANTPNARILILHGFSSRSSNFAHFLNPLLDSGFEVYAFDAPAHGASEGKTIVLPQYVGAIADFEKKFGKMHGYISHSFGGLAITHYLESENQIEDKKIVLIAPATETKTSIDLFFKHLKLNDKVRASFEKIIEEQGGYSSSHYSIIRAIKNISSKVLWVHDRHDVITPFADAEKINSFSLQNIQFVATKSLGHNRIYRDDAVVKLVCSFLKN